MLLRLPRSSPSLGQVVLVLALLASPALAVAQQICTSDTQCWRGGQPSHAECQGDTLVVKQALCAGSCREMEVRRQNCRVGGPVRCVGNAVERKVGRCDLVQANCVYDRANLETCFKSCACSKKTLIIFTGQCAGGIGCGQFTRTCKAGCTCDPEPRCLDEAPRRKT